MFFSEIVLFYEAGLWRPLASPSKIHKSVAETQWELTVFTPQMMATCHDQNTFTVEKILPKPSKLNGWRGGRACNVTWICPCWVRRFKRTRGYAITLLHGFTNYPKHCKQWLLSCPSTISVVLISVIIYNCLLSNSMFYCDFKVSNPQIYTLGSISW